MSLCSFGKFSIKGTFTPQWPYHTDLYCRLAYFKNGEEQALFCAFDSLGTWACDARKFCKELGEACGIPAKSIVFHELQAHAAPYCDNMHEAMDAIVARAAEAVKELQKNAVPYICEVSEAYFGTDCSFNREQYVEGLGGVTVWTGMGFDEKGKPCTQNEGIMLLKEYRPHMEVLEKPLYFDNLNDPLAYLFVFKDTEGKVLGTMSRFAAHPDVAVLFELRPVQGKAEMYRYDFDWPGYLSTKLEEDFGGTSIYLNGPCGDLTTKKGYDGIDDFVSSDAECKRLGLWFAEKLEKSFAENRRVMKEDFLKTETFTVTVPMREDMPRSVKEAVDDHTRLCAESDEKYKTALDDPSLTPAQMKRVIDDWYKAHYNCSMATSICGFDDETLASRMVTIDIPCVRLGDYLFVGVPGESLTELSTWLRSTFTGSKTIPLDQCNGYYSYMATPRSLTLGGYTYWCSWTTRDTIPELQKQLVPQIRRFIED